MVGSPWRSPSLADLTFGDIYRTVDEFIPARKRRILDVGCGTGFLSLELARNGHYVLGIDLDKKLVNKAIQTMNADPYKRKRGSLEYRVSDFTEWKSHGSTFDIVIFSRSLHHIPRPSGALDKARQILSPRGRIICLDFAFERFDRRCANWLYHVRRVLEQAGWYRSRKRLPDNTSRAVSLMMKESRDYQRKEKLNRFDQMYNPLKRLFSQKHFSWEPYLFWDIVMDMRVPSAETEAAFARSVKAMEESLINRHAINPALFLFVGQARNRQ